jgi:uroporphyrinogen III methyltransferase/synthase
VKVYPVYETLPDAEGAEEIRESLAAGEIDVICFTSSSTVTNFLAAIGDAKIPGDIALASIGPVTTKTAEEAGLRVKIQAEEHTIDGLVKAVSKYFAEKKNENTI